MRSRFHCGRCRCDHERDSILSADKRVLTVGVAGNSTFLIGWSTAVDHAGAWVVVWCSVCVIRTWGGTRSEGREVKDTRKNAPLRPASHCAPLDGCYSAYGVQELAWPACAPEATTALRNITSPLNLQGILIWATALRDAAKAKATRGCATSPMPRSVKLRPPAPTP